jgi:2-polyprenyl-6-methoxyphenol hydroxylase-like FAD-dependent oxidoreductase
MPCETLSGDGCDAFRRRRETTVKNNLQVAIIGAGIAGLAAAVFLARDGHSVTLVERSSSLTAKGHVVSLKGTATHVARDLGIFEALVERRLPAFGTRYCSASGAVLREGTHAQSEQTLGGFVMITRRILHQSLLDVLPKDVRIVAGTEAVAIDEGVTGIRVRLGDGRELTCDLVIAADGVHSATRNRLMPEVRELGLHGTYIATSVPATSDMDLTRSAMVFGRGRDVNHVPYSGKELGIIVYQDDRTPDVPRTSDASVWRDYFLETYRDFPAFIRQAFARMQKESEIFFDSITMVPASRLVQGRVALLGDAGSCPTFFSGMGAGAAMQGAYCLARRIREEADVTAALAAYEHRMVPQMRGYQASATYMRNVLLARSPLKNLVNQTALRFMSGGAFGARARRFYRADMTLAEY